MRSRCMSLLPRTTLHSDSEHLLIVQKPPSSLQSYLCLISTYIFLKIFVYFVYLCFPSQRPPHDMLPSQEATHIMTDSVYHVLWGELDSNQKYWFAVRYAIIEPPLLLLNHFSSLITLIRYIFTIPLVWNLPDFHCSALFFPFSTLAANLLSLF